MLASTEAPPPEEPSLLNVVTLPAAFDSLHFFYGNEETGGRPVGPCSWEMLRGLWVRGEISGETLIWCKGMKRQEAISAVEDLPELLSGEYTQGDSSWREQSQLDHTANRSEDQTILAESHDSASPQLSQPTAATVSPPTKSRILHAGSLGGSESHLMRAAVEGRTLPTGSVINLSALEDTHPVADQTSKSERLSYIASELAEMKRVLRRSSRESTSSQEAVTARTHLAEGVGTSQGEGQATEGSETAALHPAMAVKKRKGRKVQSFELLVAEQLDQGGALRRGEVLEGMIREMPESNSAVEAHGVPHTEAATVAVADSEVVEKNASKKGRRLKSSKGDKASRRKELDTATSAGEFQKMHEQGGLTAPTHLNPNDGISLVTSRHDSAERNFASKRSSQKSVIESNCFENIEPPTVEHSASDFKDGVQLLDRDVQQTGHGEPTSGVGDAERAAVVVGTSATDGSLEVRTARASKEKGGSWSGSNGEELEGGGLSCRSSTGNVQQLTPHYGEQELLLDGGAKLAHAKATGVLSGAARRSSNGADGLAAREVKRGATYSKLASKRRGRKYILESDSGESSSDGESVSQDAPPRKEEAEGETPKGASSRSSPHHVQSDASAIGSSPGSGGQSQHLGSQGQSAPTETGGATDEKMREVGEGQAASMRSPLLFLERDFCEQGPFQEPAMALMASFTAESMVTDGHVNAHSGTQDASLAEVPFEPLPVPPPALSAESSFLEAVSEVVAESPHLQREAQCVREESASGVSDDGGMAAERVLAGEYLAGLSRQELEAKCLRLAQKVRELREQNESLSSLLLVRRSQDEAVAVAAVMPQGAVGRVAALTSLAQRFSVARDLISPRPGSGLAEMSKLRAVEVQLAQLAELLEAAAQELQVAAKEKETGQSVLVLGSQHRRNSSHKPSLSESTPLDTAFEKVGKETSTAEQPPPDTCVVPTLAEKRALTPAQVAALVAYKTVSPRAALMHDDKRPLLRSLSAQMRQKAQVQRLDQLVRALHDTYQGQTGRKLPLVKVENGVYRLSGKKVHLVVANERVCLKAGGGVQDFAEYLGRTRIKTPH